MIMYDWDGKMALEYTGFMILISAVVALSVFLLYAFTALGRVFVCRVHMSHSFPETTVYRYSADSPVFSSST
jgi:hypothetical protein